MNKFEMHPPLEETIFGAGATTVVSTNTGSSCRAPTFKQMRESLIISLRWRLISRLGAEMSRAVHLHREQVPGLMLHLYREHVGRN